MSVDLAALLLLAASSAWGALRGSLRQLGHLVLLLVAFPVATRLGPRLETSVVKAVSASDADVPLVAWSAAFAGALLVGGVLLQLVGKTLRKMGLPGGADRALGALLGLVHAVVLATLLVQGVLLAWRPPERPAWVQRVAQSRAAAQSRAVADLLRSVLPLPAWMQHRLDVLGRP